MREPLATMPWGNSKASPPRDASQRDGIARSVAADLLLLEAPARLDRVEVVRIRRQVDDADARGCAERVHSLVVVCRKVVEDEDVAPLEPWEQLLRQPVD